ncbi:unnamed protein product [Brassica napus]|uniref:(rape) hypothetical protein n=1 Tax=Brassica napus TaxID=3708 RepID=A0A816T0G1_BRANA|nr:unnamed protein product [Brassica napus]
MAPLRLFVDSLHCGPPLLCLSMVLRVGDGSLILGSHCFIFRKRLNKHGLMLLGSRQAANVNVYVWFSSSIDLWRLVLRLSI